MDIFITWIAFSFIAGFIAERKGRSGAGFFILSVLLTPVIGILAALVASPDTAEVEKKELESGDARKCPFCAEIIKHEAIKCRYCGSDLSAA